MTTYAWDGEYLAADGRITTGRTISTEKHVKLHKLEGVHFNGDPLIYMAFAGSVYQAYTIVHHIDEEGYYDDADTEEIEALIIGENNIYVLEAGSSLLYPWAEDIYAGGSGGDFALSALRLGLNAREAVKHACKLDIYSGGKIKCVKLGHLRCKKKR